MSGVSPFQQRDVISTFKAVEKGIPQKLPKQIGCEESLANLIRCLCKLKPEHRIVMVKGKENTQTIKRHAWYLGSKTESFKWDELSNGKMPPAFKPDKSGGGSSEGDMPLFCKYKEPKDPPPW